MMFRLRVVFGSIFDFASFRFRIRLWISFHCGSFRMMVFRSVLFSMFVSFPFSSVSFSSFGSRRSAFVFVLDCRFVSCLMMRFRFRLVS